jgi:hypothetical protein
MMSRRVLQIAAVAWAALGASIALSSLGSVNADARLLVGSFSVGCPLAALVAARALVTGRDRIAGLLLVISVATPTFLLWIVNLPALLVGLALMAAPSTVLEPPWAAHT